MPLSRDEHVIAQTAVAQAAVDGTLPDLIRTAESILDELGEISQMRLFTPSENRDLNIAIELLVRAEGALRGGGWWFRSRRRYQLVAKYLKPR